MRRQSSVFTGIRLRAKECETGSCTLLDFTRPEQMYERVQLSLQNLSTLLQLKCLSRKLASCFSLDYQSYMSVF